MKLSYIFIGALLGAVSARAGLITVTSYTAPAGSTGSWTYLDSTGTELTDGNYGVIPFGSQSEADPWVGWSIISPTITFNFSGPVNITQVDLDFGLWTSPAQIYLPTSVDIGGTVFTLLGNELSNPSRGTLSFAVNFSGVSSLAVKLNNGANYIFLDEARFFDTGVSAAPEPATWSLIPAGLLVFSWKRLRAKARAA